MAKVSIVCITYNQEQFIEDAIKSFVAQKTTFPFEVIISDDCSTDKTPEIIKKYAKMYPEIIKPIYRSKNIGVIENYIETLSLAKSEYVIMNEGDDYFIDENKLQIQVDFLDTHPDYVACFHPTKLIYEDEPDKISYFPSEELMGGKTELFFEEELKNNLIQTNSIMYRWLYVNKNLKDVFPKDILPCDWYLHLLHLKEGRAAYLKDYVMSVYRKHKGGIWAHSATNQEKLCSKYHIKLINFYYSVYKNLVDFSKDYYRDVLLCAVAHFVRMLFSTKEFEKLENIQEKYPEIKFFIQELASEENHKIKLAKIQNKHKKYKKLFNNFLIVSMVELLVIICLVLFFKFGV